MKYSLFGILVQCFVFASVALAAAQQQSTVTGRITSSGDETGLPGVNVVIKGTTFGTTTDADGKYALQIPDNNATLIFSFIGYKTQEVAVAAQSVIDIVLETDVQTLNEVVVIGYGTQQKVTLTGAVANIKGDEMRQTKNENPQNMLTGRIAGVRVWQKSSEPGAFNNTFDIRGLGAPLVVIDGVPRNVQDFQRLNPNDIDDISVLKDASAAIYGVRAANGVVLVTTKKGKQGATQISYNGTYTVQRPSGFPTLADPFQTMTLYNEMSKNNPNGCCDIYGPSKFEAYANGAARSSKWTDLVFADFVPQTQHDLNINGGNEKTQYFIGMGYLFQGGFFKSGDLNYKKFNIRTNITTELAKGLNFNLNLSGMGDARNTPYSSSVDIIRNYWRQGTLFPAYADGDNTMLSYEGLDLRENTVAKEYADISGFHKYQQKLIQTSAALTYDFGTATPILQGLTAKGLFSYDFRTDDNTANRKEYYLYAYDSLAKTYNQQLYTPSSPNQIRRELYSKTQWLGQFTLNYNHVFAKDHHVTALFGLETQQRKGDNFYAQRNLAFGMDYLFAGVTDSQVGGMSSNLNDVYKFANSATFGRLNYTFADKYIIEGQFRYDGSSKFAKGHQWGFFPSGSVGWRASEESFFKSIDALSFISQLKLRASYGVLGDDGDLQFDWATGYSYPATGDNPELGYYNHYAPGAVFGSQFTYAVTPLALPNQQITWFTSKMLDLGMDFEAWNGLFGFSFDYFDRHRDGLFARATGALPTAVGATAPRENLNSDRYFGIDLELNHRNVIGEFKYKVKAIGTITRQKYLVGSENGPYGNSYDKWRHDNLNNRFQGVQFGYESAGRYTGWDDIWNYPIFKENNTLPGDYKYLDWNGDGEINAADEHPFAYDQTPWVNFSLAYDCSYRNFDLNFLLQGTALGSMQYQEPLYGIWGTNGGGTLTQFLDRWHPSDPGANIWDPETQWVAGYYAYTGRYPIANSTFNRVSTAYLRLKSIEFGYTLPKKIKAFSTMNLRVFANAYNLFTITGVKFVDPEHSDDDLGRLYPINKTYSIGISARL